MVLDMDVNRVLTSDPMLFTQLLAESGRNAVTAASVISTRGLPLLGAYDYTSLLCQSIEMGDFFLAYNLIEAGADVNATNGEGYTPRALPEPRRWQADLGAVQGRSAAPPGSVGAWREYPSPEPLRQTPSPRQLWRDGPASSLPCSRRAPSGMTREQPGNLSSRRRRHSARRPPRSERKDHREPDRIWRQPDRVEP